MAKLLGKVAVVTAGDSGIGLAIAQRFFDEGASVHAAGRRTAEADRTAERIGDAAAIQGDVQKIADIERLFASLGREKGKIDILVADTGFILSRTHVGTRAQALDRTAGGDLRSLLAAVRHGLPLMRDGGAIIIISPIAAFEGLPGYGASHAAKAAVRSLVRTWTAQLKDRRIRVNAVSPGPVDTPMIDSLAGSKEGADTIRANFRTGIPLGRMGRVDEIAAAALFLASDEAGFVAGTDLVVDGGMSAL